MARRVLVLAGLAAAQVGDMREYFVGDVADRVFVEVGWTEDAAAAVTPACEKVYAGGTVQECVAMMVAHIERDRTLSIEIMVDGAQARIVAVAPTDDPIQKAAIACEGLESTGWDDCTRSFVDRVRMNRGGRHGFVTPLWNEYVHADPTRMTFVQVGANCGTYECAVCGEPLWDDQQQFQWRGVVVEPNPAAFALLAQTYANASHRVSTVNAAACASEGTATLYVDAAYPTAEAASIDRREFEADPSAFSQVEVTCLSLESLWRLHVRPRLPDRVDILQLDTEKLEHAIVLATNFSRLDPRPDHVLYESIHLSDAEYRDVRGHLEGHGYASFWKWPGCGEREWDTLASHSDARRGT
jgi:FkbM family methyltransferase